MEKITIPMAAILYKWFLLSCSWVFAGMRPADAAHLHPFYISVTEINHNAKDKTLEISCKMFAEDLEQTLEKNYKTQLDFSAEKDKAAFDKLINDYVSKHLSVAVDGRPVRLTYIGFEQEKESAYGYFQIDNVASLKKLDISNSILFDFTEEEINIVHAVVNGKRQSTKLNYPEKQASFQF